MGGRDIQIKGRGGEERREGGTIETKRGEFSKQNFFHVIKF